VSHALKAIHNEAEDTAYHAPIDLGAGVSKRQADGPFAFPPAANDDDVAPDPIGTLGAWTRVLLIVAGVTGAALFTVHRLADYAFSLWSVYK